MAKTVATSEETTELVPVAQMSFDELVAIGGFTVDSNFLVQDKRDLIGVPLAITAATFWTPKVTPDGMQRGYVSCEATVGSYEAFEENKARGLLMNTPYFRPNERIVFNDGSTGIRRQIVKLLSQYGLVNVGTITEESDFDKPWVEWESFNETTTHGDQPVPRISVNHNSAQLVIMSRLGLRISEYSNEYTEEGVTFYLS